jgi:hypothetical protein
MGIPRFQFPEDPPAAGTRKRAKCLRQSPDSLFQFSISTMLLVISLVAVCLTATLATPLIGVPLCFLAVLAFVRTSVLVRLYREVDVPVRLGTQLGEFIVSCWVIVFALIAGALGTFVTLLLGGLVTQLLGAQSSSIAAIILPLATAVAALAVGGTVFVWIMWKSWPQ